MANYLIVADDTATYFHLAKSVPFRIDMPLLLAPIAIAAGASANNTYTAFPSGISLRLNSGESGLSLTTQRMVYIKGSLSGRTFTPNATVLFTDAPTDDGSVYMLLGQLYSAYQISLITNHDLYMFDGGMLKSFAQIAAEAKVNAAAVAADLSTFQSAVNSTLGDLQNQIDGSITTWFYAVAPTTSNVPASTWTTTDLKNNHLGDLYYDTQTGYAYRWQLVSSTYSWARITDTDVTKALADAQAAQDTADSKRRVFTVQPAPPYDIGDLWTQGASGDLMRCKTTKTSGTYAAADWEPASKYTDNSAAVVSSDVEYYLSTSSSTPTGGSWQTTAPAWVDGKFMFSRTKITYGSGTTTYTPSANGTNITGATGATGDGIDSMTALYALSASATVAPVTGWDVVVPDWTPGNHIWQKWAIDLTGGGSYNTTPVCTTLPAGDAKTLAEDAIAAADSAASQALSALSSIVDIQADLVAHNTAISELASIETTDAISSALSAETIEREKLAVAMESYDKKADREAVIWEDASGIHISNKTKSNPDFETVVSPIGMDCKFNGTTKAYFHTDKSESPAFHATKSMSVGRSSGTAAGWFQWTHEDDDGSLSLSYRGGAQ